MTIEGYLNGKSDDLLKRNCFIMTAPDPSPERVSDVRNAIKKYIVKSERDYVNKDLLHVGGIQDPKLGKLLLFSEYLVRLFLTIRDQIRKV